MCSKKPAGCCVADTISLRPLTPADWEIFRALRLRALRMHPGYFSAAAEEREKDPPEHWQHTLNGEGKIVLGLFDGPALIGITAAFTVTGIEDPADQSGVMAMSFIEPAYRGQNLSDLYYEARIDFARRHLPWKKLVIAHREGNEPSRRAMLKHGFIFTHTEEIDWPDGTRDLQHNYEIDLEKLRTA